MTQPPDLPTDDETKPAAPETGAIEATVLPFAKDAALDTDDTNPADAVLAHPEWGSVSMLAMAASFGAVVPSAVSAAYDNLFWNMERNGEFSVSNGGGPLEEYFRERFFGSASGKDKDDDDDLADQYIEVAERRREERERIREDWARSEHTLGSVTMTGAEWHELAERLKKGSPLYDWLVEDMRKKGEKDPEGLADLVARRIAMQGKPESDWTEQDKRDNAYLQEHPDVAEKVDVYVARAVKENELMKVAPAAALNGVNPDAKVANTLSTETSSTARTDLFSTAPDLKEHHDAALAATEPLDVPRSPEPDAPAPPPKPVQVASMPAASGGFDV